MKVTVTRDELLTALQRVQGVVEKRNTMPILANILLEAKSEGLDILATDLEISLRGFYKATVDECGAVTFSARKLLEILREIKEPEIVLSVSETNVVHIKAGRSQFKVMGLPSQDFPVLPAIDRDGLIPVPGAGILDLLKKTLFAVGDNDTRYVLNGLFILVSPQGQATQIRFVGTDGHRLAVAEQTVQIPREQSQAREMKVIIPKKAAYEMKRLLEEDETEPLLGFTKNLLIFRKSGLVLTSRLIEGNYPNYQQVIPKDSPQKIAVQREELEGGLRRVSLLSRDKTYTVKLTFSRDHISLYASHPDIGEATEEIPASFQGGDTFSAGFNAKYLLDVLNVLSEDQVTLQMESPLSPCLIREGEATGFKAVVMPVKV
ncbi:MAG: DNA polymerase III subunit beta [Nitrospirae bacterium]|nr:MAG: DNA polymerase III subunit beta [Nitrospirota bacterium]